ncbi:SAM-dependent methyltransferase [Methylosinus sp. H3A]|uniref:SAM-dependent methyltransferase n=1 Tax=Methylosinus sp. H3A TaxID=2785786 RepID=UPI0018C338CC|nr:SAM-dependent methyltransferase [Methylosinus sp. H3A]MBG0811404.1 SAM-dependent methyltransferase [Methylosinus sp. H3A]
MSGFSAEWLDLREGADHAARNAALRDAVSHAFADHESLTIADLACGAGSNLRGLAEYLPARQKWLLVDHDPALLAAASARLAGWADVAEGEDRLLLAKGARRIEAEFRAADLSAGAAAALAGEIDLVTSAAFFDLVSAQWLEGFAELIAARRLPLYAILSYSGEERWTPPHAADAQMLAAFHRHQARDKGFGPAAGPRAAALLRDALERRGYVVETAPSPWRLGAGDRALIEALAEGSAAAVAETGEVSAQIVEDWRRIRRGAAGCEIGHVDVFALPERR